MLNRQKYKKKYTYIFLLYVPIMFVVYYLVN